MLRAYPTRSRTKTLQGYIVLGGPPPVIRRWPISRWGLGGDCGCGCHGRGSCKTLGALLTAQQAESQAQSGAGVNSGAITSSGMQNILASINAGVLMDNGVPGYIPGSAQCAAAQGTTPGSVKDLSLVGSAGALALTTTTTFGASTAVGAALAPFSAGISLAISTIVGLFSTILAHHAQAVAKEQSTLCSAVPAANNYLNIIQSAVAAGQATPAQAIQALNSLSTDFDSAVSSIRKMGGGSCNAACVMTLELRGIIAYLTAEYQQATAVTAAAAAPAVSSSSGSGPTSTAPVSSGSTLTIPQTQTAAGSSTPAVPVPLPAAVQNFPWMAIAALAVLGLVAGEVYEAVAFQR